MAKQLTEKAIAAAKPKDRRYYLREGRGFALQILPSGTKAFVYLYELNKSKGYILLGHYPDCSLAQARLAYYDAYKIVKSGIDPRSLKSQVSSEPINSNNETESPIHQYTFQSLLDEGIPDGYVPSTVEQLIAVYYLNFRRY